MLRIDKGTFPRGDAQSYRPLFGGGGGRAAEAAESAALYGVRLASLAGPTLEAGAEPPHIRRLGSLNAVGGYAITAEEEKGPQRKLRAVPRWFLRDTACCDDIDPGGAMHCNRL